MALEQATWNLAIGTPCEFVLLNPGPAPLLEGRDFVCLDAGGGRGRGGGLPPSQVAAAVEPLSRMLDCNGPRGVTPVADRLDEIHQRVRGEYADLAGRGQRVVLVIATDGLPTSAQSGQSTEADRRRMVSALKRLMTELPVFVVIRLTTDEDSVIEYYNKVDQELELPLEVLDDIESEAKEIRGQGNSWLTYSPLLHRIREGGTFVKFFDLLDERRLTPVEASLFAQLLLRREGEAPMPTNAQEFCDSEALETAVGQAPMVYDPICRRLAPPIYLSALRWAVIPAHAWAGAKVRLVADTFTAQLRWMFGGVSCTEPSSSRSLAQQDQVC